MDQTENPFDTGAVNPGADVGDQIEMRTSTSVCRGSYHTSSRRGSYDTGHDRTNETSFIDNIDEHTPLIRREENVGNAWDKIRQKFPRVDPAKSPFTASLDEYDRVMVKLKRSRGKSRPLFAANGELENNIPPTITKALGPTTDQVVEKYGEEISKLEAERDKLITQRETAQNLRESQRETLNHQIDDRMSLIADLEREKEEIEGNMSLRDIIKAIFKKYGFTVLAVVSAVGVVIGVVVANLKKGLTSLGKGVGKGLKTIGKKLGEILPGLVGAIASFVFRTAGEVISFLAKNAWLLIVALVLYFVEQFKNKK